jgi:endogenous inhibitor of DNA gyrase (YacG/DUF329 family)
MILFADIFPVNWQKSGEPSIRKEKIGIMICVGCGEKIKGEPYWLDNQPFCSKECAEIDSEDEEFAGEFLGDLDDIEDDDYD